MLPDVFVISPVEYPFAYGTMKAFEQSSAHMLNCTLSSYIPTGMEVCVHFGEIPRFLLLSIRANIVIVHCSRRDRRKTPEEQNPSPNAEQPAEVAEETNNDDDLELPDLDP